MQAIIKPLVRTKSEDYDNNTTIKNTRQFHIEYEMSVVIVKPLEIQFLLKDFFNYCMLQNYAIFKLEVETIKSIAIRLLIILIFI